MPATRFALDTYRAPEGSPRRHKTCYVPLLLLDHECCMPACLNRAKSWSDTHARCCQLPKLRPAACFTVLRDGVERHMRSTLQMRRAGGFTDTSASFGLARRSAASTTSWIDLCRLPRTPPVRPEAVSCRPAASAAAPPHRRYVFCTASVALAMDSVILAVGACRQSVASGDRTLATQQQEPHHRTTTAAVL